MDNLNISFAPDKSAEDKGRINAVEDYLSLLTERIKFCFNGIDENIAQKSDGKEEKQLIYSTIAGEVGQLTATGIGCEIFNDYENNIASSLYAHAEGNGTKATAPSTHAEGNSTTASSTYAHAEGYGTTASGTSSHAEGENTTASGIAAMRKDTMLLQAADTAMQKGIMPLQAVGTATQAVLTAKRKRKHPSLTVCMQYPIIEAVRLSASATKPKTHFLLSETARLKEITKAMHWCLTMAGICGWQVV